MACQPYDAILHRGCPHWREGEEPPDREVCLENQCERTLLCRECQQVEVCPIVGYPKITPENQEALRTYSLLKSGIIPPLDQHTTPARTLDRLAIINSCVTRAENAMIKEMGKRGAGGR